MYTCKKQFMSFPPQFFLTVSHKMWRFDWPNDNMTWNSKNNHCSSCATTKLTFHTELKYIPKSRKKKSNSWKIDRCCSLVAYLSSVRFFFQCRLSDIYRWIILLFVRQKHKVEHTHTCGNNEVGNVLFLYAWIKCQKVWVKLRINILNDR